MKFKKVVKIPNNQHLLKIIFQNSRDADRVTEKGMQIQFQRFQGNDIERELFVPIAPCFRCFAYGHFKRNCLKPDDFVICTTCAFEGHTYKDCPNKNVITCINCSENHRTLAAKCPIRKDLVRTKIREIRAKSRSVPKEGGRTVPTLAIDTTQIMKNIKLPDNYLAVMAAAITLAEKRETEVPGTFQFILDEMLKANNIPTVKFPNTVISGYKDIGQDTRKRENEKRKRTRTSDDMTAAEKKSSNGAGGGGEYVIAPNGNWKFLREGATTPQTIPNTPASTPAVTPAPTPAPTPVPSPAVSPQRPSGAVPKRQREEREKDPGLVLIARTEVELPNMNNQQLKKEVLKGNLAKYCMYLQMQDIIQIQLKRTCCRENMN